MAEEAEYGSQKRKYEEETSTSPPRTRRPSGFSDGPPPPAYGNVPPPLQDFELAKQKIQQLANLAFNADSSKRSKFDIPSNNYDQKPVPVANSYSGGGGGGGGGIGGGSKKIEIPNGRVGVIIGRAGDTIKNLQNQSGARIQVTRDADHDPSLLHRTVELMGNQDQIAKAEQLINDLLAEADTGGPGSGSRRQPSGATGFEPLVLKVPNNKVGLVIGKGGETIKSIQSTSGARVQVIPLHLPPGEAPMERTVQIDGTPDQIEIAKQMVNEVIENRLRNPTMTGAYPQQSYQARPPTNWAPQPPQMQQPGGYGYMQQSGAYPGAPSQYNQQPYSGYPPQNWDQSSATQNQQPGYDYYGQQQPPTQQQHQQQAPNVPQNGNASYSYNQPPASGGYSQEGYSQEGYGAGYHGYGQPAANPPAGYDHSGYGNATNPPTEGHPPAYGSQGQGDTAQQLSSGQPQQGYIGGQPSPNPNPNAAYPTQPGYGAPPASQPSYGTPSVPQGGGYVPGYGPPQGQKTPPNPTPYGQPQQSPSQGGGYAPPAPGYPPSQPPAAASAATYGGVTAQPGSYPVAYGAPPSYAQQPYYGGAYSQPAAYPTDDGGAAAAAAAAPTSQPAAQPNGAAKASPQS